MYKKVFISVIILFLLILLAIPSFISEKDENIALNLEENINNIIDDEIISNSIANNLENKVIEITEVIETESSEEIISKDQSNNKSEETSNNVKSETKQEKIKTQVKEENKKVVEESKTEEKSIKVKVDPNTYVELEAGYAVGGERVELPKEWNY